MLFWVVLAVVLVLALVALGVVAHGVLGAFARLNRELEGAEEDVRPLLTQAQATAERASGSGDRAANPG